MTVSLDKSLRSSLLQALTTGNYSYSSLIAQKMVSISINLIQFYGSEYPILSKQYEPNTGRIMQVFV